jgi:hypothetical protein
VVRTNLSVKVAEREEIPLFQLYTLEKCRSRARSTGWTNLWTVCPSCVKDRVPALSFVSLDEAHASRCRPEPVGRPPSPRACSSDARTRAPCRTQLTLTIGPDDVHASRKPLRFSGSMLRFFRAKGGGRRALHALAMIVDFRCYRARSRCC